MSTRIWLSVAIAIAAATASSQDFGKPVTFSAPATRAAVLFPELSKALGFELKTTAQTENEVLLIQVHEVTIHDLMDRISNSANAEWKKEGRSYRLIRPAILVRKSMAVEMAQRSELFKEFLALEDAEAKSVPGWSLTQAQALAKSITSLPTDPRIQMSSGREVRDKEESIRQQWPTLAAIHGLLDRVGARDLAALDPDQRAVFALHSTSMQFPLNSECSRVLEQFVASERQFAEEVAKIDPSNRFQ